MFAIAFGTISLAACSFLIYVSTQFYRELLGRSRRVAQRGKRTGEAMRQEIRSILYKYKKASYPRTAWAKKEAVMRKEILTSLLFGVIGLLAPFLFVLLVHSNTHGWNR
jgi:hypothetical protein